MKKVLMILVVGMIITGCSSKAKANEDLAIFIDTLETKTIELTAPGLKAGIIKLEEDKKLAEAKAEEERLAAEQAEADRLEAERLAQQQTNNNGYVPPRNQGGGNNQQPVNPPTNTAPVRMGQLGNSGMEFRTQAEGIEFGNRVIMSDECFEWGRRLGGTEVYSYSVLAVQWSDDTFTYTVNFGVE